MPTFGHEILDSSRKILVCCSIRNIIISNKCLINSEGFKYEVTDHHIEYYFQQGSC